MQTAKYRIYVDGAAIAQQALDTIDTIVVEQEMDQTWTASIAILVRTSDRGHWAGEDSSLIKPLVQIRIEVAVDDGKSWIPLIDGPVTGYEASLSPEPGQSTLQVRVSDDSIRLWRQDDTQRWTGKTDTDKACNIFRQSGVVHDVRFDPTDAGTGDRPKATMQRGTLLETLQLLARNHPLFHAWVAAGDTRGQSIGMFKREDTAPSGLPPLILLGLGRNLDSFSANSDQQRAADVTSWQLNLSDLSVKSGKASYGDQVAGNDVPAVPPANTAKIMVPPGCGYGVDADEVAKRHAADLGVLFEARGTVRSRCYGGVLQPYKMVEVTSVNGRLSGNYVIKSVTHTLARSEYTQEFSLIRRGQSGGADAANPNVPPEPVS